MKRSIFKAVTVLLLSLSLGMHWTVLQSVAWFSMMLSYSQEGSLQDAVIKTFDGDHPCQLCFIIRSGKESEAKEKQVKFNLKYELFYGLPSEVSVAFQPYPIPLFWDSPPLKPFAAPPIPPPRSA